MQPWAPATPTLLKGPAAGTRGVNRADVSGAEETGGSPSDSRRFWGCPEGRARGAVNRLRAATAKEITASVPMATVGGRKRARPARAFAAAPFRARRLPFRGRAGHVVAAGAAAPRRQQEGSQEAGGA